MDNLAPVEQLRIMPTQSIIGYFIGQQSSGTARTYLSTIKLFFAWTNNLSYKQITPFLAMDYSEHINKTASPATVQRHISTLNRFFMFAMKCGLIETNPFAVVRQKAAPITTQNKFLTAKELNKLLTALKELGEKQYVLGLLLAATGMRISEVRQLSWNSFLELPDETIAINVLGKGGEYNLLPLREDVWTVLKSFTGKEVDASDNNPIFLNPSHQRISADGLRDWIRAGAKKTKISKIVTPHTLRHTFCSLSLSGGASVRDVQAYARHKHLATTERYLHEQNMRVGEFMPIKVKKKGE